MSYHIHYDERGLGTLEIPDAEGECQTYHAQIVPPGLALWAILFTRIDSGNEYLTRVFKETASERWVCNCKAFEFKKRGVHDCKHTLAARGLRIFLRKLLEPMRETINGPCNSADREALGRAI